MFYIISIISYKNSDLKWEIVGKRLIKPQLFEETFINHNLLDKINPINILSDGGSENKGALLDWINQLEAPPIVRKLTARTIEFPHSNSMSESTHSIFKTEFMQGKHSVDKEQHLKDLETFVSYYNEERYPFEFYGLTPLEVLNGEIPNKTRFRKQIKQAQKKRIEENRKFNKCQLAYI